MSKFVALQPVVKRGFLKTVSQLWEFGYGRRTPKRVRSMRYLPTGLPLWVPMLYAAR